MFSTKTMAIIAFMGFVLSGLLAYQYHSEGDINRVFFFAWFCGYCLASLLWKLDKLEREKRSLQK